MAKVKLPQTGGCQCGAVRYEVKKAPIVILACHCTNCQKISGSAFVISVVVKEIDLVFAGSDRSRVEWQADSGNERWGEFCEKCGSRLIHGSTPSTGSLILRGGTLDDTSWTEPVAHIWTDSAQPWFPFDTIDHTCPGQPAGLADYAAEFKARGLFEG